MIKGAALKFAKRASMKQIIGTAGAGALAGLGASAIENRTILDELSDKNKGFNNALAALTLAGAGGLSRLGPKGIGGALALTSGSWPVKHMMLSALDKADKFVDLQIPVAEINLNAAEKAKQTADLNLRRARHIGLGDLGAAAAGIGALGGAAGLGYYLYNKMGPGKKPVPPKVRVTLPTMDPNDSETSMEIPVSEMPVYLQEKLRRDVRRRLRNETRDRTERQKEENILQLVDKSAATAPAPGAAPQPQAGAAAAGQQPQPQDGSTSPMQLPVGAQGQMPGSQFTDQALAAQQAMAPPPEAQPDPQVAKLQSEKQKLEADKHKLEIDVHRAKAQADSNKDIETPAPTISVTLRDRVKNVHGRWAKRAVVDLKRPLSTQTPAQHKMDSTAIMPNVAREFDDFRNRSSTHMREKYRHGNWAQRTGAAVADTANNFVTRPIAAMAQDAGDSFGRASAGEDVAKNVGKGVMNTAGAVVSALPVGGGVLAKPFAGAGVPSTVARHVVPGIPSGVGLGYGSSKINQGSNMDDVLAKDLDAVNKHYEAQNPQPAPEDAKPASTWSYAKKLHTPQRNARAEYYGEHYGSPAERIAAMITQIGPAAARMFGLNSVADVLAPNLDYETYARGKMQTPQWIQQRVGSM